jgi:hypothetical protein
MLGETATADLRRWIVRIGIALVQGVLLWWLYDTASNDL